MLCGPSEDMDAFALADAKVPAVQASIWDLEKRVSVCDFKQLLLDPVGDACMMLQRLFRGSIRPARGAFAQRLHLE